MKMNKDGNRMSGLEWFAVLSGVIGLVADFVTIGSMIHSGSPSTKYPTVIWFLVSTLILYTTIVLSFYARRIAVVRHKSAHGKLSEDMFWKIEKGSKMVAKLIGTPLILLFAVSLALSFWNVRDSIPFILNPISIMAAWFFADGLGNAAGDLYAAFDPSYHVAKKRKE